MHIKNFIFIIIGLFFITLQSFAITLSENGKTNYTIVISTEASPSELHGAQELQYFLQIITGAYLPVSRDNESISGPMVLVGNSSVLQKIDPSIDFPSLGDEGFIMKTNGVHLILAGGKLRGSMYAVYTFLEKLGCRWYSTEASKIPSIPTLTVESLNEVQKPAFAYREPFWFDAFDADWAARNKCNSSSARLDEQRGGKYKYWGGHSFYPLVPPDTYFKDHPEYYSLINGKRIWEYAQLCLTNMELVKLMTNNILEVIKKDPDYNVYEISQNDWTNWCTCADCKAIDNREESQAGSIVNFVNLVADRVKNVHPEKLIGTFAYWYSEKAPKAIMARDNVCIRLCNIVGCDAHHLTDCPININRFAQNMEGWKKLAKNIIIWDYVTNFSHYLQPYPNWYATWKDLKYFKQNNVIGIFEEGAYQSEASAGEEIEAYLQAKNLWNPDIDYHEIMDDFLSGYYHKAAPAIRNYMDFLQDRVTKNGLHFSLFSPPTIELFSPENLAVCDRYFDEAEKLVKDDQEAAYRVEEARLGIRYVKLAQPIEHVLDGDVYKISPYAPPYANLRELNSFIEDLKKHEVTLIREAGAIEQSFAILRANVSNHQVVTLENPYIRIDVIPDLGGRIYRIINKKSSRNILRIPTTKEYPYPLIGGYSENPGSSDVFSYTIERTAEGQRLIMEGYSPSGGAMNALKINRIIFIPADKKEIQFTSTMESLSEISHPIRIAPALDLSLGSKENVKAGALTPDQKYSEKRLGMERDDWSRIIPTTFREKELQQGTWIIVNSRENAGVMSIFNPKEVEVCSVIPDTATGGIRMSLQGNQRPMKPGDKQTLSHKIIPIDDVDAILKNQ